jgi:hypothetical protein
MASVTHAQSITGGGVTIQSQPVVRTNSGPIGLEDTLSAAKTGTLSTRTDNNTGTLTMDSGHGITDGQIIDIYWSTGVQRTVTVGTVSVNSVPFDLGIGDNLPIATTAITAVVQKAMNLLVDGDNTKIIAVVLETVDKTIRTLANVQFKDADADVIAEIDLVANVPQVWDIEGGSTNPFTGDVITNLKASQANSTSTETYTLKIVGVQDASP